MCKQFESSSVGTDLDTQLFQMAISRRENINVISMWIVNFSLADYFVIRFHPLILNSTGMLTYSQMQR